jgi:DNA polymerase-3 subunit gamma/tau
MRDALSLTDQAIAFGNGELQEPTVRDMLGSVDRSHVFTFIEALAHGDGLTVVNTCEALRQLGLSASSLLEDMSMVLQRMAVYQSVTNAAEAATDPDPDAQRILALAELLPADETQLLYSICLHGRTELGLAPDEYVALCMVLLRLLAFKPDGAAEKKTLKTAEAPLLAAPSATAPISKPAAPQAREIEAAQATAPISKPAVAAEPPTQLAAPANPSATRQPTPLGNDWLEVVQQLVKSQLIQAMTRELAMQSQLLQKDATTWVLQVERESLNSPSNRERLQLALQALGHAVSITVQLGPVTDTPAKRITTQQNERQQAAEDEIMNDPLVQQLIREFDATIVPGSIKPLAH